MDEVRQFVRSQFGKDERYRPNEKAMETIDKIVYRHPFWKRLNPDYFQILVECASCVKFGSGQPIFQADSDAEYFYLIDQGSVGLEMFVRGKGVIAIETIGAGEALGWSWLFPPYRWHFSARSHAATEAVAFAAPVLRQCAEANHSFGYELAMRVRQVMLQRLQATRAKLVNFYGAFKTTKRCGMPALDLLERAK